MRVLVASHNGKKVAELRRILESAGLAGIELVGLGDIDPYPEPQETGRTFADNALIKARAGHARSGLVTVADDSGLSVDELNGMPGVLSARWSGAHGDDVANYRLLLSQLADTPDERRAAAFVSVCALVDPQGREVTAEGRWEGRILRSPRGDRGFGYDPVFLPEREDPERAPAARGRSAAELNAQEKDACSHRGQALRGLVPALAARVRGE